MRKRIISTLLSFFFLLNPAAAEEIKIGVSVPLTGPGSTYGEDVRNALAFANEKIAGNRYSLIIEDDQCSGKTAASVAQKLVHTDKVKYVLGLPCSGAVLSSAPVYDNAKVIMISALGAAPSISDAGDYIFRTRPSDRGVADVLVPFLSKRHKNIGTLTEQTDFALGTADAVARQSRESSLSVVQEDFPPGTSDFKSLLLRLRSNKIDALFISTQSEQPFAQILKEKHELDWNIPVYSSVLGGSKTFLKIAGPLSDGIIFATLPSSPDLADDKGKKLYSEFIDKYGEPHGMDFTFLLAWESFNALHQAIQSEMPVKQFLDTQEFTGLAGNYRFDAKGDVQGIQHVLKTVKDGKILPLT